MRNCLFILFLLIPYLLSSQTDKQEKKARKDSANFQNSLIPIAFYLPETGFAFGGTGIATFRFRDEPKESRPSQFLYSAAYTLKNQLLLFFPYELYRHDMKYRFKGELGFYKYFYNYFGLGPDSELDAREIYDVVFPRFELLASYRIHPILFVGLGYKFDYFNIRAIESGGILETTQPVGVDGGVKSNVLLNVLLDSRDNIFSSSKGIYVDATAEISRPFLGSSFSYQKFILDARHFVPLSKQTILASNLFVSQASADAPFFDLPYLSTTRLGRGFSDRRFIDYTLISAQTEVRFPIYWRFGGAAFVSASTLGEQWAALELAAPRLSGGFGLRFALNQKEKTSIRLDAGFSGEEMNFYITANEAF